MIVSIDQKNINKSFTCGNMVVNSNGSVILLVTTDVVTIKDGYFAAVVIKHSSLPVGHHCRWKEAHFDQFHGEVKLEIL